MIRKGRSLSMTHYKISFNFNSESWIEIQVFICKCMLFFVSAIINGSRMEMTSTVSIDIPASLFEHIGNLEDVGLVFTYYDAGSLFPVVETAVIGALVANTTFSNLSEPIRINLPLLQCVRTKLLIPELSELY